MFRQTIGVLVRRSARTGGRRRGTAKAGRKATPSASMIAAMTYHVPQTPKGSGRVIIPLIPGIPTVGGLHSHQGKTAHTTSLATRAKAATKLSDPSQTVAVTRRAKRTIAKRAKKMKRGSHAVPRRAVKPKRSAKKPPAPRRSTPSRGQRRTRKVMKKRAAPKRKKTTKKR